MGIIDDYLAGNTNEPPASVKGSGLIQQYLDAAEPLPKDIKRVVIDTTPKPPISGVSKESSDELNARVEAKGGENPRRGITSVPTKAAETAWDALKAGGIEAGRGLGEVFSGKPASGIGKVGTGLLGVVTSPWEGAASVASDLTGDKTFGSKVGLGITGAAPIKLGVKALSTAASITPGLKGLSNASKNKSLSELVDDITSGGRDQQALVDTVAAMKADPRIGPADTSPAVLGATQRLFVKEGSEPKNYLHNTSKDRISKLGNDVSNAFDEASGLPVNAVNKLKELSAAAEKVGKEKINPAKAGAGPVNITPVAEHIDEILKPGVLQKITGESTLPFPKVKEALKDVKDMIISEREQLVSAEQLHNFQSALRKEAEARIASTDGEQRQLGHALMAIRNKVVDAIDEVSPKIDGKGSYKPALNEFRTEKEIGEAFHDAYNGVLTNSKKLENRPEFTKEWFDGLTKHEKEAAIQGIRTRIDTEMGVSGNPSLAGTNLGKSDFNQKKMEAILGKEETDKLLLNLENTRRIKNTDQKIVEGSQTAAKSAADKKSDLPVKDDTNPLNKYITPAAATAAEVFLGGGTGLGAAGVGALAGVAKVGSALAFKAKTAIAKERNAQYARHALPVEGPERDELIRQLEAHIPGPKQSLVTRGAQSLSRLVSP